MKFIDSKSENLCVQPMKWTKNAAQKETLNSLQRISRSLYVMDYTAPYSLDDLIRSGKCETEAMYYALAHGLILNMPFNETVTSSWKSCCTSICGRLKNGQYVIARNYDDSMEKAHAHIVFHTKPANGYESISSADTASLNELSQDQLTDLTTDISPLLLAPFFNLDGVNEKGLGVTSMITFGNMSEGNTAKPYRINQWAVVQLLLDQCATVQECIALLKQFDTVHMNAVSDWHWLVQDASGDCAILEYVNEEFRVLPNRHSLANRYENLRDDRETLRERLLIPKEMVDEMFPTREFRDLLSRYSAVINENGEIDMSFDCSKSRLENVNRELEKRMAADGVPTFEDEEDAIRVMMCSVMGKTDAHVTPTEKTIWTTLFNVNEKVMYSCELEDDSECFVIRLSDFQ